VVLLFLMIFRYYTDPKSRFIDNDPSESIKPHLRIRREEIFRNPEKVNTLLREHNITNVRIMTEKEFQDKLNKTGYLNKTKLWR